MVQKKKGVKSTSPSSKKSKLSDKSLDWITDTIKSDAIFEEQAENIQSKSAEVSKESKIGVFKHYESEEVEKKKDEKPEEIPAILGSSSTITKGEGITPAKKEEAQKTEVKKEKKMATEEKPPSVPDESAEIAREEKEKTISTKETPVEIGKTYKITEEKKLVLAEEEEKTVFAKKETVPDEKKTSPEYEVKKEDETTKEEISIELSVRIPENSSSIVKKRKVTVAKEEETKEEETKEKETKEKETKEKETKEKEKPSAEEKKIAAVAAKEEVPPSAKRIWMQMSVIGESLKKEGKKVSGAVVKPLESDKAKLKKSVCAVINVSKQPVKAVSAVDRKITQSTRVLISDFGNVGKSIFKKIKSTDTKITKSAEKMLDSILD